MQKTQAWILPAGDERAPAPGRLRLGSVPVAEPGPEEALVEPLLVGWEGNSYHAVERRPIDVCRARGEDQVVLGNSGIVRVLRAPAVPGPQLLREGDVCLVAGNCRPDRFGYMMNGGAFGYDAPGTVGLLAKRTTIPGSCLVPLPEGSEHTPEQWAAFSIRYIAAYANWRVAYGVWRLQVTPEDQAVPYVWGWGGGTAFAELSLAAMHGAEAAIVTSKETRMAQAKGAGLTAVDRREFPDIGLDKGLAAEPGYKDRHKASLKRFLEIVRETTDGNGVSVFVDHLGGSLLRATLGALAREGVLTTAGWRDGLRTDLVRASECIERRQHVHTHYARRSEVLEAMEYGESRGWMPANDAIAPPWSYEDLPNLVDAYASGAVDSYFPLVAVNS